ncbi:hypothetical protein [Nonomuraea basaltis]|uniref:hypothetical protein n=1 Tax=Nonomuraea basaltis TaxID=2495887 RepID=UPI00110C5DE7|nr:hypothetical protein [Nonomuraea basaltis]TMR91642.1 hypothetical protein EJK15_48895 [Nonomuraea basaltis]
MKSTARRPGPRAGARPVGLLACLVLAACTSVPGPSVTTPASDDGRVDASRRIGRGPLKSAPPTGYALRYDQGAMFTDGWVVLYNFGDAPVTVTRVTAVLDGNGLRQVGARVAGYGRKYTMQQTLEGFPPRADELGPLAPAEGYVLPAEQGRPRKKGHELLIGLRVTQATGRTTRTHVEVAYTYKGRAYTDRWVNTIAVCSPRRGPDCPQEYAE